jgi:hypothetical protein
METSQAGQPDSGENMSSPENESGVLSTLPRHSAMFYNNMGYYIYSIKIEPIGLEWVKRDTGRSYIR